MSKIRHASWGSDKSYRYRWRAALQSAIFAFRQRMNRPNNDERIGGRNPGAIGGGSSNRGENNA